MYIERILHITADIHETYRSRSAFGETDGKRDEVFFAFNIIAMVVVTANGQAGLLEVSCALDSMSDVSKESSYASKV